MEPAALIAVAVIAVLVALLRWGHAAIPTRPSASERGFLSAPRRFRFFVFTNVIIPDERGTTEVDVVVVGNSGVFVVEIKDFNAWIFGSEHDEKWTACYVDKSKHQFQNPLRQNFRHVKALQARTGLPSDVFHSIVAFTGDCELKTPMPSNVIVGGYRNFIENTQGVRLSDADAERVCRVLEELEAASTTDALDSHVADLRKRFSSSTTCPKCGARLVERRSRSAPNEEPAFLGCQSFPRCRYTRQLDAT
jgi:hypothetical protein